MLGQGVEAQTLANVYQAMDNGHEIVPVLNKVDLPAAEPEKVKQQIEDVIGIDASDAVLISAKTGEGVPGGAGGDRHAAAAAARATRAATLKALLIDSWYDAYLGVVVLFRVVDGALKKGQRIRMMGTNAAYDVDRVGVFTPKRVEMDELGPGEIGFLTGSIKEVADTRVGDTITDDTQAGGRAAARFPAGDPGGVLRAVSGRRRRFRRCCARRWAGCGSTMRASPTRWRRRPRSASVSAADFSACCTWKSSRSGWSASSTRPDHDRAVGDLQDQADERQ